MSLRGDCLKFACPAWTLAPTAAIDITSLRHDFSRVSPLPLKCRLLPARRIDSTLIGEDEFQTVLRAMRNPRQRPKTAQNRQQTARPHLSTQPLHVTHARDVNLTLSSVIAPNDVTNVALMTRLQNSINRLARQQITSYKNSLDADSDGEDDEIINSDDDSNDDVGENNGEDGEGLGTLLPGFQINDIATFNPLLKKLELTIDEFLIKVDLDNGFLRVRTVPGLPHGAATGAYVYQIGFWSENNQPPNGRDPTLIYTCDANMSSSILSANSARLPLFCTQYEIPRCVICPKGHNISTRARPTGME